VAIILDEPREASTVGPELAGSSDSTDERSEIGVPKATESKTGAVSSGPAPFPRVDLEDIEGQIVRVSISHDGAYCTAVALAPEMH